jgi:hypothetical protein
MKGWIQRRRIDQSLIKLNTAAAHQQLICLTEQAIAFIA